MRTINLYRSKCGKEWSAPYHNYIGLAPRRAELYDGQQLRLCGREIAALTGELRTRKRGLNRMKVEVSSRELVSGHPVTLFLTANKMMYWTPQHITNHPVARAMHQDSWHLIRKYLPEDILPGQRQFIWVRFTFFKS